jgi:iron complex transport system ATP-binding protein
MLEARDVSLEYGPRRVLDGISFAIGASDHVALVGPNGAGKSSLLRCLTGLAAPRTGVVFIDGRPLMEIERHTLARLMAVVPGQTVVAFPMLVEDLVALGRIPHEHRILGLRPADRARVDAAIERVGITELRGRDVRELSLGERQLAVLAMAIAQDARVLLLDEPTVHLDLHHQVRVMELLRDLAQRDGTTVLAVLHDIALVRHFFDRLLLLDRGRLVGDGRPGAILTGDVIRDVYGVDPRLVAGLDFA